MANLKDLVKKALAAKNGETVDDGHDAVAAKNAESGKKSGKSEKATKTVGSKKPTTRVSGRGR